MIKEQKVVPSIFNTKSSQRYTNRGDGLQTGLSGLGTFTPPISTPQGKEKMSNDRLYDQKIVMEPVLEGREVRGACGCGIPNKCIIF